MATYTSPSTVAVGDPVTASLWNTYVRDNELSLSQAWTAYTPTWASTGTPVALGNGTCVGAWVSQTKWTAFRITLTSGTTTTYGTGSYSFTLPTTPVSGPRWSWSGWFFDTSAGALSPIYGHAAASTTINLYLPIVPTPNTAGNPISLANVTGSNPVTMATGDSIHVTGLYEAA